MLFLQWYKVSLPQTLINRSLNIWNVFFLPLFKYVEQTRRRHNERFWHLWRVGWFLGWMVACLLYFSRLFYYTKKGQDTFCVNCGSIWLKQELFVRLSVSTVSTLKTKGFVERNWEIFGHHLSVGGNGTTSY